MKEYQKIETLYRFDSEKRKFVNEFYNPIVKFLEDKEWIISEKIDGQNIRVHWDGHKVEWSGRTDKSQLPKEVEQLLQDTFGNSEIIFEQQFGNKEVYLFMECYGGKIQGGIYGGKERLIGFDVMVDNIYLDKLTIKTIFDLFNVKTIPFVLVPNLKSAIDIVIGAGVNDNIKSDYTESKETTIEGYVCVPKYRLYDHMGNRIIVKIKVRDLKKLENI